MGTKLENVTAVYAWTLPSRSGKFSGRCDYNKGQRRDLDHATKVDTPLINWENNIVKAG